MVSDGAKHQFFVLIPSIQRNATLIDHHKRVGLPLISHLPQKPLYTTDCYQKIDLTFSTNVESVCENKNPLTRYCLYMF